MLQNNIENVIFEQIEFCYHNTTGLRCVDSLILFDGHSTFVNKSGIKSGGITLYQLQLLLNQFTFNNNRASDSGGEMFVLQFLDISIATDCYLKIFLLIILMIIEQYYILSTIQSCVLLY